MGIKNLKNAGKSVEDPDAQIQIQRKKHNGRGHSKDFKIAAVKLVTQQNYAPKQAALSLGIPLSTLQYWIKIYGQEPKQQAQTMDTLRLRIKELEAENQRLKIEREILKKATAFFASHQP